MDESWTFRRKRRDDGARRLAGIMLVLLVVLVSAIGVVMLNFNATPPASIGSVDSPIPETPVAATPAPRTAAPVTDPSPAPSVRITQAPDPTAEPTADSATPQPEIPVDATLDAALARCPTAAEISLVDSRIRLTFVDDPTAPKLVCRKRDGSANLTRLQERAYQAVLSMRRIKFDEPLPWTDRSMFGWFTRAVTGIQFAEVTYSHCCARDRDIVIRSQTDMSYLNDNHWVGRDELRHGLIGLIGLMFHEARHAEGYPHTCGSSEDPSTGYIDDQTLEEMGGWAVTYWYLMWLSEHTDDTYMTPVGAPADLYRAYARESAEDIYNYRICDNYE